MKPEDKGAAAKRNKRHRPYQGSGRGLRIRAGALAAALLFVLLCPAPAALAEGPATPPANTNTTPGAESVSGPQTPAPRAEPEEPPPAQPTDDEAPDDKALPPASAPATPPPDATDAPPAEAPETADEEAEDTQNANDATIEIRFWVGGKLAAELTQQVQPGGLIPRPAADPPVPAGLAVFRGWYADPLAAAGTPSFDFDTPLPAGTPAAGLDLYALFAGHYTVTYLDGEGHPAHTRQYAPGQPVPGLSPAEAAAIQAPAGQSLTHWALADDPQAAPVVFGFPAAADLILRPCFSGQHQVVYASSGGPVAGSPQAVAHGAAVAPPASPARPGYSFLHWSISPQGPAYDFAAPLTADLVLYAVWQAADTAEYTVLFWLEAPNLSADPDFRPTPGAAGQYRAVHSLRLAGAVGAAPGHTPADFAAVLAGQTGPEALKYAEVQQITNPAVAGDGTTVVQVYCARKVYTLEFGLGHANYATTLVIGGVTYRGTGAPYSFRARLGQDISALYPWPPAAELYRRDRNFAGWLPQGAAEADGWYAVRPTLDAGMLPADGQAAAPVQLTGSWNQNTAPLTARFYAQALPHQLLDAATPKVLYAGTHYCELEALYAMAYTLQWNAPSLPGLAAVAPEGIRYANFSPGSGPADKTASRYFLYTRQSATLAFNTLAPPQAVENPQPVTMPVGQRLADALPQLPAPQRPGHTFAGWYHDQALTHPVDWEGTTGEPATMPAGGLVLFAKWVPQSCTVTYTDPALGTLASIEWPAAAPLAHPEGFDGTEARYTPGLATPGRGVFQGWAQVVGGRLVPFPAGAAPGGSVTLIATWRAAGLAVRYLCGQGLAGSVAPRGGSGFTAGQRVRLAQGDGLIPPPGTVFAGWQPAGQPGAALWPAGTALVVEQDLTLEAQYLPAAQALPLACHANLPAGAQATITIPLGVPVALPDDGLFTRAGHRLAGWSASADPGPEDTIYLPGQPVTFTAESLPPALYALWVRTGQLLVRFQVAGGSIAGGQAVFAVPAGTPLSALAGFALPTPQPDHADATWAGWFTGWQSDEAPGAPWSVGPGTTAPVTEDTLITGVYTRPAARYTVRFTVPQPAGGAEETAYSSIPAGTPWAGAGITVPAPQPAYPHLVFGGWSFNTAAGEPALYPSGEALAAAGLVIDRDLTFTAVFNALPKVTVRFVAEGPGTVAGGSGAEYAGVYAGLSWSYNHITLPAAQPGVKAWFVGWAGPDGAPLAETALGQDTLVPEAGAVYTARFAPQSPLTLTAGSGSFPFDGLPHTAAALETPYTLAGGGLAQGHYIAAAQVTGGAATPAEDGTTRITPGTVVVRAQQGPRPEPTDPDVTHRYDLTLKTGAITITRHQPAGGRLVYLAPGRQAPYAGTPITHTAQGALMLEAPGGGMTPYTLPPGTAVTAHRQATATGRDAGTHPMAWERATPAITLTHGGTADVTGCFDIEYRLSGLEITPAALTATAQPASVAFGQAPVLGLAITQGALLGADSTAAGPAADLAALLGLEGRPLLESPYTPAEYTAPRLDITFTPPARAAARACRNYTLTLADSLAEAGGGLAVTGAVRVSYQNPVAGAQGTLPAGGVYPAGSNVPVAAGTGLLTHPQYSFAGWRGPNGTLYPAAGAGQCLQPAADTTLTAVWVFKPGAFTLAGFNRPYNGQPAATALAGPLQEGDHVEYTIGNKAVIVYEWQYGMPQPEYTQTNATPPANTPDSNTATALTVTLTRPHIEPLVLTAPAHIGRRQATLRAYSRTAVAKGGAVVAVPDPAAGLPAPGFAPDTPTEDTGLLPGHRVEGVAAQAAASAPGKYPVTFTCQPGAPQVLAENGEDVTANYTLHLVEGVLELLPPAPSGPATPPTGGSAAAEEAAPPAPGGITARPTKAGPPPAAPPASPPANTGAAPGGRAPAIAPPPPGPPPGATPTAPQAEDAIAEKGPPRPWQPVVLAVSLSATGVAGVSLGAASLFKKIKAGGKPRRQ